MQGNGIHLWFKLLEHHPRRLTLPFIIGALRESGTIPMDGADFEQVYQLFQDMAAFRIVPSDRAVYVQMCPDLKVPVFSIWDEEYTRSCRARYPVNAPGRAHLCFSTEVESKEGLDLKEIARRVYEKYDHRSALSSKHYSRDFRDWRPFDNKDRLAIRSALGY
jgi:hypothetical protein